MAVSGTSRANRFRVSPSQTCPQPMRSPGCLLASLLIASACLGLTPLSVDAQSAQDWEAVVAVDGGWEGLTAAHRAGLDIYAWPISINRTDQ